MPTLAPSVRTLRHRDVCLWPVFCTVAGEPLCFFFDYQSFRSQCVSELCARLQECNYQNDQEFLRADGDSGRVRAAYGLPVCE